MSGDFVKPPSVVLVHSFQAQKSRDKHGFLNLVVASGLLGLSCPRPSGQTKVCSKSFPTTLSNHLRWFFVHFSQIQKMPHKAAFF